MAKQRQQVPAQNATARAASQVVQQPQEQQVITTQLQQYQGQIPPPDILRGFDELIPGTAGRVIQWAEDEQAHRRRLESEAQSANIEAQRRQLAINEYQSRAVFRSDALGQTLGAIVCLACAGGAVWLGLTGNTGAAVALAAIPTAAVIQSFRSNFFGKKTQ